MLIQIEKYKIEKYISTKDKEIMDCQLLSYKVGIVFAEQYISELADVLLERHPEFDLIAIVNTPKSISYRTKKDNVDVSEIAKFFNGGGHIKAAGSPITDDTKIEILNLLFTRNTD